MEDIEKVYKKNDDDIDKIELKLNNFLHIGEKSEFKTYLDIKKYLDLYFEIGNQLEWDSSSWLDFGNVWYSIENEKTICNNKDSPMMSLAQYQRCYDLIQKLKWNKNIFNFIIKNKKFEIIDKLILESKLDFLYFIKNSNLKLPNTTNNLLKSKIILEEKRLKYISSKNHLSGFPSKLSKKIDLIKNTLIKNFEFNKKYSEDEVNEIIYVYGLDNCEAKMEMVSLNFLNRTLDGSKYWGVK